MCSGRVDVWRMRMPSIQALRSKAEPDTSFYISLCCWKRGALCDVGPVAWTHHSLQKQVVVFHLRGPGHLQEAALRGPFISWALWGEVE